MRKFLIALACVFCLLAGTCFVAQASARGEQTWPLKVWFQNQNGTVETWYVDDEETGVNYVVVRTENYNGVGLAITPRLNEDGTPYLSKKGGVNYGN